MWVLLLEAERGREKASKRRLKDSPRETGEEKEMEEQRN
jgi:hypothetical protein